MRTWSVVFLMATLCMAGDEKDEESKEQTVGDCAREIRKVTTEILGDGTYEYTTLDAHERIVAAVRGLGCAERKTSEHTASVTDWLLYVLLHDRSAVVRAIACQELGQLAAKLPLPPDERTADSGTGRRIHQLAQELYRLGRSGRPDDEEVVKCLRALADERPGEYMGAQQAVRAFAIPPARSNSMTVREAHEELAPYVMRVCILVCLRKVGAVNPPFSWHVGDASPLVRKAAWEALLTGGGKAATMSIAARVGEWISTLRGPAPPEMRFEVLGHLAHQLKSEDPILRETVTAAFLRTAMDPATPPELAIAIFRAVAKMRDASLVPTLACFVHHRSPEVRVAAATATAQVAGMAALPTLLHWLGDEDPQVETTIDSMLGHLCGLQRSEGPPRAKWLGFVRTDAGSKVLTAAFVRLAETVDRKGDRREPLVRHVTALLLDAKIPHDAWLAGYRLLRHYVREDFRPARLRGQAVKPEERAAIVAAIRAWVNSNTSGR